MPQLKHFLFHKFVSILIHFNQYSDQCFCGNTYGRYGKSDENDCNAHCAGDSTKTCGGTWRNSVYRTGMRIIYKLIEY